jgi:ferredoxin-NADP reductase
MLQIGACVQVGEPEGEFVITDPDRDHVFVAAGVGIAPFRSILADADHHGQKLNARLLYGSRDSDVVSRAELDGFAARNQNLRIDYIIGPQRIDDERLQRAIESAHDPLVYLSGPEPMVEDFAVMLKRLGVGADHIQTDYFTGYDKI